VTAKAAWPAAVALGLLCSLGFDPVNIPYAMVVGVAGLLWLARRLDGTRTRTVAVTGALFGLAFFGPLIWWMNAVSPGAYVALVVAETLFFVPIMLALRAAVRLPGWPLWAAAVWVAGELARSGFPFSGFPWGRLAHTSIDGPFSSYARYLGMAGTSAVLVLVSAMLVVLVSARTWRPRLVAVGTVVVLAGVGALLPTGIAGAGQTRQVALVQGGVPGVFLTWPRGEIFTLHAAETERLARAVEAGETPRPDMVLWPENATDVDPNFDPGVRSRIESLSRRLEAPILVGGIFDGPTAETALNAGVVWDENGPGERYVKREPVPYGEYVPLRGLIEKVVPRLASDIPRDMLPGDDDGALRIADTVVGDTICYDIAYDGVVRDTVGAGAELLVVQTSNASFTGTSQVEQQWKISRLRAIETGRYVLVPSTNGISGVVGPDGEVVERAPQYEPATVNHEVTLATGTTMGLVVGAPLAWALALLGLVGWVLGTRRGPGR
jgi:apolipoprotein N-acyltransferase